MSSAFVLSEVANGVGWIILNDPERLNPVTPARVQELNDACREMSARDDAAVVVVTGAGRGFCSGADLTADIPEDLVLEPASGSFLDAGPGLWTLTAMRQPVIAMVNGAAVGYGAELCLQADIRIAATSARFRYPFSLLGTVSDTGAASWILPRLVGPGWAADLLYTGRMVDATEALRIGLVQDVVPDTDLRARVEEYASELTKRSAWSLREMKRLIFAGLDERKAEHVMRQHVAFRSAEPGAYRDEYWSKAKGSTSTS